MSWSGLPPSPERIGAARNSPVLHKHCLIAKGVVLVLRRLMLGLWFGSCAAWSVPVVVDQTTTDFQFVFTNATGVPGSGGTGVGSFVLGPDTPPAGSGSVNFQLPDGDHSVGLQTSLFSGT